MTDSLSRMASSWQKKKKKEAEGTAKAITDVDYANDIALRANTKFRFNSNNSIQYQLFFPHN